MNKQCEIYAPPTTMVAVELIRSGFIKPLFYETFGDHTRMKYRLVADCPSLAEPDGAVHFWICKQNIRPHLKIAWTEAEINIAAGAPWPTSLENGSKDCAQRSVGMDLREEVWLAKFEKAAQRFANKRGWM